MRFKSPSRIVLLVVSLFVLVASPCLLRAQQKASEGLREQAAKLQQDIEALKKSKADLSGRISASLLSSLESEIQAKQTALDSTQQNVKQAEALERDIADLTTMRDKMHDRISADLLRKLNDEVAAKQQSLEKLSDLTRSPVSAVALRYNPAPDPAPAMSGTTPAESAAQSGTQEPTRTADWTQPTEKLGVGPTTAAGPLQVAKAERPRSAGKPNVRVEKSRTNPQMPDYKEGPYNAARFLRIYEDTNGGRQAQNNRLLIYDPKSNSEQRTTRLSVDENSTLVIVPDPELIGTDATINNLFLSAELASGDSKKSLEVTSYSEVGKDKAGSGAQQGMAFQSADEIQDLLLNMAYTAEEIIDVFYSRPDKEKDAKLDSPVFQHLDTEADRTAYYKRLEDTFRLHQPEITTIAQFFQNEKNLNIVGIVGKQVFWVDRASLQAIAKQYSQNLATAFDSKSTDSAKHQAFDDLLDRTRLVYDDFADMRRQVRDLQKARHLEWASAVEEFAKTRREQALAKLKNLFVPGYVSLHGAGAKDGDTLTIKAEVRGGDAGEGQGVTTQFEIAIKRYGWKPQLADSFMFIHREHLTLKEITANPNDTKLNRVNFAPSPGMTFGVVYLDRGDTGWHRFCRALGPGFGMNVSFMNFNDPGFDLTTQKFTNTTGVNVQVGAGVVGGLFDNKLQITRGWNLNADQKRQYWGIGFGFIEIGKTVAKYVKEK
jgi:hypothetical protein